MSIERNILLRATVETLIGLAADEGFTEAELLAALKARHPEPAASTPTAMTRDEAMEWERVVRMPFGQQLGACITDVSTNLLCWYADQRFTDELRRYLKSPRGRERIEKESIE